MEQPTPSKLLRRQSSSKNAVKDFLTSPRKSRQKEKIDRLHSVRCYIQKHIETLDQLSDFLRALEPVVPCIYELLSDVLCNWCRAHVTGWSRSMSQRYAVMDTDGNFYVMMDSDMGRRCMKVDATPLRMEATVAIDQKIFFAVSADTLHKAFTQECELYVEHAKTMLHIEHMDISAPHALKMGHPISPRTPCAPALPPEPKSEALFQFALTVLDITSDEYENLQALRAVTAMPPPPIPSAPS